MNLHKNPPVCLPIFLLVKIVFLCYLSILNADDVSVPVMAISSPLPKKVEGERIPRYTVFLLNPRSV